MLLVLFFVSERTTFKLNLGATQDKNQYHYYAVTTLKQYKSKYDSLL